MRIAFQWIRAKLNGCRFDAFDRQLQGDPASVSRTAPSSLEDGREHVGNTHEPAANGKFF
jgi:hypothetical protein